ncbi:hypothetical protein AQ490_12105 [Wenjunlia vitaminophila]|uniref:Uncharacterized protein n=1 Tax=Wenjunlia vitaminophila TaxID=76728 RepID=A0A0T6LKY6_WENVI|nr:hypothetical protein AQ490_12105 [Wenjunlia vitaminophila]
MAPPSLSGGRQVRADGEILGVGYDVRDLLEFCRRAGLNRDDTDLCDRALIEWRGESCSRSKQ